MKSRKNVRIGRKRKCFFIKTIHQFKYPLSRWPKSMSSSSNCFLMHPIRQIDPPQIIFSLQTRCSCHQYERVLWWQQLLLDKIDYKLHKFTIPGLRFIIKIINLRIYCRVFVVSLYVLPPRRTSSALAKTGLQRMPSRKWWTSTQKQEEELVSEKDSTCWSASIYLCIIWIYITYIKKRWYVVPFRGRG